MYPSDKWTWDVVVAALVGVGILAFFFFRSALDGHTTPASTLIASPGNAESPWVVSRTISRPGAPATILACTASLNELAQASPYHAVKAELCLRYRPGHKNRKADYKNYDAIVQLRGDGQVVCAREGCNLRIRIDDKEPVVYAAAPASDGASNVLFLLPRAGFAAVFEIGHSTKTAIEVTPYKAPTQVLLFDTHGLDYADLFETRAPPLRRTASRAG